MSKAIFFHAGCPVCIAAEQQLLQVIDQRQTDIEIVHLGQVPDRIAGAEKAGVKSVPALVLDGNVFHINFGASLDDLKGAVQ